MTQYIIVGGGGFGLNTALNLRINDKNAKITIFDRNIGLSSTINSGNGLIKKSISYIHNLKFNDLVAIREKNKYSGAIYLHKINNIEWALVYLLNYFLKSKKSRDIINKISSKYVEYKECKDTHFNDPDYWPNIIKSCKDNGIDIIDMTEIIDYNYDYDYILKKDNNNVNDVKDVKINVKTKDKVYQCDKLILSTAENLNLIKNDYYHKFIECFSGLMITVRVKNKPKCYSYSNGMFICPYKENMIKIGTRLEWGYNKGQYNIDKNDPEFQEIIKFVLKNKDLEQFGIISFENIWRGTRAMTYDILPFFTMIDKNVYWISGGNFLGTHLAQAYGKWLGQTIQNMPLTDLPDNFDPTLERLINIRSKIISVILIFLTIIIVTKITTYNKK